MAPFCLLRLPLLPVLEVVKHMKTKEMYNFSRCSKKCQQTVRNAAGNHFELRLYFWTENEMILKSKKGIENKIHFSFENFPVIPWSWTRSDNSVRRFPYKKYSGLYIKEKELIKYLVETFNCIIGELRFHCDATQNVFQPLLNFFLQSQFEFHLVAFDEGIVNDEDFKYLMDNCKMKELDLLCSVAVLSIEDFKIDVFCLRTLYSDWVTQNHLLKMTFELGYIQINCNMKKWMEIVKAWMNGWNKRMKFALFETTRFDLDLADQTIENVIPGKRIDKEVIRQYPMISSDLNFTRHSSVLRGGYDFQRKEDGVLATITQDSGPQKRYVFAVWQ
ncbi:hypothetical protein CRE_18306 [Caenorhabditis remanei]|uniref:F-box domain-containing protein n=1 Tax=Caenorhabditis remanei TaxID=31234 RepID=E3NNG7_CAERE|nr:hypothetical protein CRE_18306 [Caenorhabditis remanei]